MRQPWKTRFHFSTPYLSFFSQKNERRRPSPQVFNLMLSRPLTLGDVQTSVHLTNHLSFSLSFFFPYFRTIRTIRQLKPARRHRRQAPTKWWVHKHVPCVHSHTQHKKCVTYPCLYTVALMQAHSAYAHHPYTQASLCVRPDRVGCKFIMVRRADGTVLRGLCWDCGGPLINHTDVIGRWEPHGHCRAEHWAHALSPLWLTPDRDGVFVAGGECLLKWRWGEGVKRNEGGRKGVDFYSTLKHMVSFVHTPHRPGYYGYGHYRAEWRTPKTPYLVEANKTSWQNAVMLQP